MVSKIHNIVFHAIKKKTFLKTTIWYNIGDKNLKDDSYAPQDIVEPSTLFSLFEGKFHIQNKICKK